MGGGLLQLVAYGAQDVYLTGNPQITFFKVVYRRHTNFALESIQQTFNGNVNYGQRVTCTISRNGDLINRAYLQVNSNVTNLVPYFGLRLINYAEIEIGGQKIDKHYSEWMYIWNELSMPIGKKEGYFSMVGGAGSTPEVAANGVNSVTITTAGSGNTDGTWDLTFTASGGDTILDAATGTATIVGGMVVSVNITNSGSGYATAPPTVTIGAQATPSEGTAPTLTAVLTTTAIPAVPLSTVYVPLEFWFCRNVGLALPLIGLQYHEVKVNIQFETLAKLSKTTPETGATLDATLWIDYIYLDTDERRKFAQSSHEYLIEQLQFIGKEGAGSKMKLNFNHPVKELVWVVNNNNSRNANWFNFTKGADHLIKDNVKASYSSLSNWVGPSGTGVNPVETGKLILNGNDRFSQRDGNYFNLVQPFQHHENVPNNKGINVYSFALKPEEHQPSGTLNMSRIDTATLDLSYLSAVNQDSHSISIYSVNYNVLRILSGMGGIAYSN